MATQRASLDLSMQQMSLQQSGASGPRDGAHSRMQTELLESTSFTGSGKYPTSSSVLELSQSTASRSRPAPLSDDVSMQSLPDCFKLDVPLQGFEPVIECKGIPPFDPLIAENYDVLNKQWLDPSVKESEYRASYEDARQLQLVPLDSKDMLDGDIYKKATASDPHSAAPFCFSVQGKLFSLTQQLKDTSYNRSQNISQALLCLHYLAHVETGENPKLWMDALDDLTSQTTIFRTGTLNYYDVKQELDGISRKQVELNSKLNPRQMICGSDQINFCQSSPQRNDFLKTCETSDRLMTSLQSSSLSSVPRTSIKMLLPSMSSETKMCLDITGGTLRDATYKFDPNLINAPSYPLFSDKFKEKGFEANVNTALAEKCYTEQFSRDLFQLHMACKVLERDIPNRFDYQDLAVNLPDFKLGEVLSVPQIKKYADSLRAAMPGESTEKFIGLLHTQVYLKELIPVLESKAIELGVSLYCFDLPKWPN
ncbi:hypothetical protein SOPP22_07065 [Shewanella sp. OPT22]|nr:hypothetical protein SOPP22_07065 [Shewanella sp. OPT22]